MKKKNIPLQIIAVRKANREIEKMIKGDGFHSSVQVQKSKKQYYRKKKHKKIIEY